MTLEADLGIASNGQGGCTVRSNSIPSHDLNDSGSFATPTAEVMETNKR